MLKKSQLFSSLLSVVANTKHASHIQRVHDLSSIIVYLGLGHFGCQVSVDCTPAFFKKANTERFWTYKIKLKCFCQLFLACCILCKQSKENVMLITKLISYKKSNFLKRRRDEKPPLPGSGLNQLRVLRKVKHPLQSHLVIIVENSRQSCCCTILFRFKLILYKLEKNIDID